MHCEINDDSDLWFEKQKHKKPLTKAVSRLLPADALFRYHILRIRRKQAWTIEVRKIQKFPSNQQEQDFLLVARSECERCRRSYVCVCNFSPWVYCRSFEVLFPAGGFSIPDVRDATGFCLLASIPRAIFLHFHASRSELHFHEIPENFFIGMALPGRKMDKFPLFFEYV